MHALCGTYDPPRSPRACQADDDARSREAELVAQLDVQARQAKAEREATAARAAEALELAVARAREEREAAVEQCNQHWMDMMKRQSAASASAAEAAEAAHAERLSSEVARVAALEEASLKSADETAQRLREVEEAVRHPRPTPKP
jgi:hypothetical protein